MTGTYIFHAWPLSYYSGKLRAYLNYKAIPYVEKPPRVWTFGKLKQRAGAGAIPVVVTPEGAWLQDTADIIGQLEQRFPKSPVEPASPRQRIAAHLIEAWGDEFWVPSAMHYRWSFPENFAELFQPEAGDLLLPFAPRFIKDRLAQKPASLMRSFVPGLGVVPAQVEIIERWTESMLDALDAHFAALPYLLGTRPSIGDFGLIGPLFAHLGRDPYPKRVLIEPRPHLKAWIARMQSPDQPLGGDFLADDQVPGTLQPILQSIFTEFWPFLARTQDEVTKALPSLQPGRGLRRSLGEIEFPTAGKSFRRLATPFSLWKIQRALDAFAAMSPQSQGSVKGWLDSVDGAGAMRLQVAPRLKRIGLHVMPEAA
ncbi:MAG TPA: glutathione S-transferase family protein [Nevskiaceae bacterium]|nr:glutathione S-transferase family protein [Nevskiaceae bacterium]